MEAQNDLTNTNYVPNGVVAPSMPNGPAVSNGPTSAAHVRNDLTNTNYVPNGVVAPSMPNGPAVSNGPTSAAHVRNDLTNANYVPNGVVAPSIPNGPAMSDGSTSSSVEQAAHVRLRRANPFINFLFCICGTSATQHMPDLVEFFRQRYTFQVVATKSALKMFSRDSIRGDVRIYSDEDASSAWACERRVLYRELSEWADFIVVMPASSNTITEIAIGLSNNLLTNVVKHFRGDVYIVPDMDQSMYEKATTTQEIADLTARGYVVMDAPEVLVGEEFVRGPMTTFGNVNEWLLQHLAAGGNQHQNP